MRASLFSRLLTALNYELWTMNSELWTMDYELSLVRILHIALIMRGKGIHNGLVATLHRMLHVLGSLSLWWYGVVNGEREGMPRQEPEALLTAEHIEGAVYGDGDYRQLELVGQLEGTPAEKAHVTGKGAGTLWKDEEAGATPQYALSLLVGGLDGFRAALVHHDMSGTETSLTHQGDTAESLLHHPLEVTAQEAIDEEDIVRPLMISHKDV